MSPEALTAPDQELTVFHPVETELSETTKLILDQVREHKPVRVVLTACLSCGCWRRVHCGIDVRYSL
jgi:hypothetical protein